MTIAIPRGNCGRGMVEIVEDRYCLCINECVPDCPWDDAELVDYDGFGCDAYTWCAGIDPDPYHVISVGDRS